MCSTSKITGSRRSQEQQNACDKGEKGPQRLPHPFICTKVFCFYGDFATPLACFNTSLSWCAECVCISRKGNWVEPAVWIRKTSILQAPPLGSKDEDTTEQSSEIHRGVKPSLSRLLVQREEKIPVELRGMSLAGRSRATYGAFCWLNF